MADRDAEIVLVRLTLGQVRALLHSEAGLLFDVPTLDRALQVLEKALQPRCRIVWVPGLIIPPDSVMPTVRTRCCRTEHTDGEHAWTPETAALLDGR